MSSDASGLLTSSFVLLDRITPAGERKIWNQGVTDWQDFRQREKISGIGKRRKLFYDSKLQELENHYHNKNFYLLLRLLPRSEHWRLFPLLKEEALYVDIETAQRYGDITVLGAWDGTNYYSFVKGFNLDKGIIKRLFSNYKLFITFNGSSFDIPIIRRYFGEVLPEDFVHVDLRHLFARLGLRGGLKSIEVVLGVRRGEEIAGMCGEGAALLWHEYLLTGDEELVELLLQYNEADCRNLEPLARYAVEELWRSIRQGKTI